MVEMRLVGNPKECDLLISEICGDYMVKSIKGPLSSRKSADDVLYYLKVRTDYDCIVDNISFLKSRHASELILKPSRKWKAQTDYYDGF